MFLLLCIALHTSYGMAGPDMGRVVPRSGQNLRYSAAEVRGDVVCFVEVRSTIHMLVLRGGTEGSTEMGVWYYSAYGSTESLVRWYRLHICGYAYGGTETRVWCYRLRECTYVLRY